VKLQRAPLVGGEVGVRERLESFIELSEALTGFSRVQLLGTGMAEEYLGAVEEAVPAPVLEELLAAGDAVAILEDGTLGPVARNVILLWYCGTWTALADEWHTAHGSSPVDVSRVVSAESYQAGLQWVAARAHPIAARPQGYGAWSVPPTGDGQ
jgi:hypothetical protein